MLLNRSTTRKFLLPNTNTNTSTKANAPSKKKAYNSAPGRTARQRLCTAYGEVVLHMAVSTISSEECSTNWWM
jgi:hypothetical protein